MGYYINPPESWLRRNARKITAQEAATFDFTSGELPVCWVDNGAFSAAGIAYDERERDAFLHPDPRPKMWFAVKTALLYDVSDLPRGTDMRGLPDWMEEWRIWGYAIGSSERYKPKWYEARAYVMGLRDAARIAESLRFPFPGNNIDEDADPNELRARRSMGRQIIEAIHRHALSFVRLMTLPDLTKHAAAAYRLKLRGLTNEELFEAWAQRYEAECLEHVALIIAEMNERKLDSEAIKL